MKRSILTAILSLLCSASLSFAAPDRSQQLKVYNWADYIDEELIGEFEQWYQQQTGEKVEIIYQLFDVNEIMLSKIEKGHEDFDVVCPSDYIIERMLKADLLLPIKKDFGQTPDYTVNVAPFMAEFMHQIDGAGKDANLYTVPYMWGSVGIIYNENFVSEEEVRSWNILKDPKFQGKLFMKEAFRDVYNSLNIAFHKDAIESGEISLEEVCFDTSAESIAKVEAFLNEVKPNIAGWEADFGKEQMTKEKAWLNLSWSGDAQWAIDEATDVGVPINYAIPEEGSSIWFDGWVIPKYAKNVKAAEYFINFMCLPQNAIRNMNAIGYVSAIGGEEVLEAQSDSLVYHPHDVSYFFGPDATNACVNPIQYPDRATIERCGMMHDRGTEELLAMWTRLKGDNASSTTFIIIGVLVLAIVAGAVFSRKKKSHRRR